jgi:hypothetical protein
VVLKKTKKSNDVLAKHKHKYPLKDGAKSDLNLKLNPEMLKKSRGDEVPSKSNQP